MENAGRKILVVDDNLELAETVSQFLEKYEFQASFVLNGSEAIEKVLSESPELVLLDLNLPDTTGMEVLKRIKEINKDIAVIVITGYGGEQVAVDIMKAGALDFLSKPFGFETLLDAVKNTLKIRDAQIEDEQLKEYSPFEKFFPFLAHEIRNPLQAIAGALTVIRKRSDLKDEILAESVKIIEEEIQHLNRFVQDCLDFVRPLAKSRFVEVEIDKIIPIVIHTVSHIFEELSRKIRITTDMDPRLPKVYVNYDEIMRAFLNIIKNAFEAMDHDHEGELIIKTYFKSNTNLESVGILFIDNGLGIKKENLKNLFYPFFTTKRWGNGLGLAICKRIIVERHHGRIHIESEENKGTTVTVELPVSQSLNIDGVKQL
jgi:signal transduction histidine kinase